MKALTATQAKERCKEIASKLDALDFQGTRIVAVHDEDGSFAIYRDAFAIIEGDWAYVFREHGDAMFLYVGDDGGSVTMYDQIYGEAEYSVESINKRRAEHPYVQKYMKPREDIK